MQLQTIRALLFDAGHTLWDLVPDRAARLAAFERVRTMLAERLGIVAPAAERLLDAYIAALAEANAARQQTGDLRELTLGEVICQSLGRAGIDLPATNAALVDELCELYHVCERTSQRPAPDAQAVLDRLQQAGLRLALVSNTLYPARCLESDLVRMGLRHVFDALVLSSGVGWRKPDQRIYLEALRRLGTDARAAVFVGDRLREDIQGPQALGMRAVLTRQFRREELDGRILPDACIETLTALPEALALLDRRGWRGHRAVES
jgi:HAD superfamily hydrolase (TIGR01509 family)